MPEPRWAKEGAGWDDAGPQKHRDILGMDRRSKSYNTGADMAFILTKIRAKRRLVIDFLKECHANYYRRPVWKEDEETGEMEVIGHEPEELSDDEIIARYSGARLWDDILSDFPERMTSLEGFSIKAVSHLDEEEKRQNQPESSTGSDRRTTNDAGGKTNTRMQ